ncbi:MAG: ECF transporter S component [Candidatus Thorarchaeota archaeon]
MPNEYDHTEDELVLVDGPTSIFGEFNPTVYIALLSLFTAMTTVATILLSIPFPTTTGYFNLGDTLVMMSGFLLGPIGGFIAGGVGSAMGDVALGYFLFVPVTFIAKGLEGMMVGIFSYKFRSEKAVTIWDIVGVIFAALMMLGGYYFGEIFILGFPPEVAFVELITINILQVTMGGIVALLVGPIVRKHLMDILGRE